MILDTPRNLIAACQSTRMSTCIVGIWQLNHDRLRSPFWMFVQITQNKRHTSTFFGLSMAPLHYFRAFFQSPSWQMANHPPKLWYFSQVNPHRNQACEPTWNRLPIHMGDHHHHRPLTPTTSSLRCCSGKATEASRKLPRPGVGLRLRQKMLWQVIFKLKQHVACGALIPGPVVYDCLFVLVFICIMGVCIRVIRTFMAL